jgi:hypothetical protein
MNDSIRVLIDDGDDGGSGSASPRARTRRGDDPIAQAEQQASEAFAEAARMQQETTVLRLDIARNRIGSALATVETEANQTQTELREAMDCADFERSTSATARLAELEARKVDLRRQEQQLARIPTPPADPVEAYCMNRTAQTAAWLRAHPDYVTNPRKNAMLTAKHFEAVAEGLQPDTPEYFTAVEKKIGLRPGGGGNGGRSNGGASNDDNGGQSFNYDRNNPNTHVRGSNVFLTEGEAKAADETIIWNYGPNKGKPVGRAEYARRKAAMVAEGRYNKLD